MPPADRFNAARVRRFLREAFTERLPYKAAALFLSCVLWLVASAEEPTDSVVAVRFEPQLDSSLTLLDRPQITALVVGARGDIFKLFNNPPTVRRIFGPETPDVVRLQLSAADVQMPPGIAVDVRAVNPSEITLRFSQRREKLVPVESRVRVRADSGFLLAGTPEFVPESVIVSGDRQAIARVTAVPTQRGEVVVRDSAMVVVPLDTTGLPVRVRPTEVRLRALVVRDSLVPIPGLLPWNRF